MNDCDAGEQKANTTKIEIWNVASVSAETKEEEEKEEERIAERDGMKR